LTLQQPPPWLTKLKHIIPSHISSVFNPLPKHAKITNYAEIVEESWSEFVTVTSFNPAIAPENVPAIDRESYLGALDEALSKLRDHKSNLITKASQIENAIGSITAQVDTIWLFHSQLNEIVASSPPPPPPPPPVVTEQKPQARYVSSILEKMLVHVSGLSDADKTSIGKVVTLLGDINFTMQGTYPTVDAQGLASQDPYAAPPPVCHEPAGFSAEPVPFYQDPAADDDCWMDGYTAEDCFASPASSSVPTVAPKEEEPAIKKSRVSTIIADIESSCAPSAPRPMSASSIDSSEESSCQGGLALSTRALRNLNKKQKKLAGKINLKNKNI